MRQNIFSEVKQYVTARSAAEFYGIHVNHRGMARCPFHDDHTPSMLLDQNYYCFGCHAKGDTVAFVSKLFGLRPIDAAIKLIHDMHLPVSEKRARPPDSRSAPGISVRADYPGAACHSPDGHSADTANYSGDIGGQLQELTNYYYSILVRYRNQLQEQKTRYKPRRIEDEWDPRFEEALSNLSRTEYLLDLLLFGGTKGKIDMMKNMKDEVNKIEEKTRRINTGTGWGYPESASGINRDAGGTTA